MRDIKDTQRSTVRIGYDGKVHKSYRGPLADERCENEIAVLQYLEKKGCEFVPKLIEANREELFIVTTNCGQVVSKISSEKEKEIFSTLESKYGVRHEDAFMRNITYSPHLGRFCLIDFEFATILESGQGLTLKDAEEAMRKFRLEGS